MEEEMDKVYFALKHLDKQNVLELLDEDINPNYYVSDGHASFITCYLYKAVTRNEVEIVEKLLQKGADPNFEEEEGETPLFAALENDMDSSIQKVLYSYGANKNHKNKAGNTPLMHLALRGSDMGFKCTDETLFNLLSGCEDFLDINSREQSLIHLISYVHSCEQVTKDEEHICRKYLRILTANGVSVNTLDGSSLSPMHYACKTCCMDAVIFLFEHGADHKVRTNSGQSVIHLLGCNPDRPDFQKVLEFLLSKGCSVSDVDSRGRTILHYITESNKANRKAIECVISYGLDPNTKDNFGLSPLHLSTIPSVFTSCDHMEDDEAMKFDVSDIVKTLVDNGADVNAKDKNGLTPLHYALRYEEKDTTVQTLLSCGADVALQTKTGENAVHRATLYPNLLQILLEHIISKDSKQVVTAKDNYGSTALHWAVFYFEADCVEMLLQNGADINILDGEFRSPAQFAIYLRRTEVFKSLGVLYCRETHPLPYILREEIDTESEQSDIEESDSDEESVDSSSQDDELEHKIQNDETGVSNKESITDDIVTKSHCQTLICEDSENESEDNVISEAIEHEADEEDRCVGVDHMWCDCPILKTLWCEEKVIFMEKWNKHIKKHNRSLAEYIKLICNSNEMGLYQETYENNLIAQRIHRVMDFLAKEMKTKNPTLLFSLKLAGSWSEGSKVVFPEEFDYKLILDNFSKMFEPIETEEAGLQGFVKFALKKEFYATEVSSLLDAHGFLDGRKVVRALYVALNSILIDIPANVLENLYPVKYLDTEMGSVDHISFRWVGWSYKNMLIDIDIVPAIVPVDWVPKCFITTRKLLQTGAEMPFPVVIKTPNSRYTKDWYTYFRISMADREVAILKSLPTEVLKGYILVKSLLRTLYFPQIYIAEDDKYKEKCLTSYLLKTAFLHELEIRTNATDKINNNESKTVIAIKMALAIVHRLEEAMNESYLEPYFLNGVNTLVKDSLFRFNDYYFYECEVECLNVLLNCAYMDILNEDQR